MKTKMYPNIAVSYGSGPKTRTKSVLFSLFFLLAGFLIAPLTMHANNKAVINFNLKYGFIKGGEAHMIIKDTLYNGKKAIHYYMEGRTTGITDKLFKVHDIYESIVDARTYLPYKAIRNIKERTYRYYNEIYFYQDRDSLYSEKTGGMKVPSGINDILSVFFYFVQQNYIATVEQGKPVVLPVINGDAVGDIRIKHTGIKTIDTDLGKVECYHLSPEIEKGKVLKRSDGLSFFISRNNKIPVLLDIDLKVGTLQAVLTRYTLNGKEIRSF